MAHLILRVNFPDNKLLRLTSQWLLSIDIDCGRKFWLAFFSWPLMTKAMPLRLLSWLLDTEGTLRLQYTTLCHKSNRSQKLSPSDRLTPQNNHHIFPHCWLFLLFASASDFMLELVSPGGADLGEKKLVNLWRYSMCQVLYKRKILEYSIWKLQSISPASCAATVGSEGASRCVDKGLAHSNLRVFAS